jgi:hypothetical protein
MTNHIIRHLASLKKISEFNAAHGADFTPGGQGAKLFATVSLVVNKFEQQGGAQVSGTNLARSGTATKAVAYHLLHDDLVHISETAHGMAATVPGLDKKFRMPRSGGDQALLNAARAFRIDAEPLKAQFIAFEMPADFLDQLDAAIAQFDAALKTQTDGTEGHVGATAGLDQNLADALAAVRQLTPLVRNKYRANPSVLAEWETARHTERAAKASPAKPATKSTG